MSTVIIPNCACCGPRSGSGSGSGDGGSGSGDGPEYLSCADCSRSLPASVTVTFVDQGGVSVTIGSEGGTSYCCATPPPGDAFAGISVFAFDWCVAPGPWQFIIDRGGPTETVLVQMVSCVPLILTGTSTLGDVVITE